jgi:hypothetical protein|tara:strand:+ start:7342 stop:7506 length:165 start_codon:yes stop_codon:yes gene_type:complete
MNKTCIYCGKDIDETKYWLDPKFCNPSPNVGKLYFCGPECSTNFHDKKLTKDKK